MATGVPFHATTTSPASRPAASAGEPLPTLAMSAPRAEGSLSAASRAGSMGCASTPSTARGATPWSCRRGSSDFAMLMGIAKPMPWAGCSGWPAQNAALMPMTAPAASMRGPPELPTLIEASVWMKNE